MTCATSQLAHAVAGDANANDIYFSECQMSAFSLYLRMQIQLRKLNFTSRRRLKSEVPTDLEVFLFRPF